MVWEGEKFMNGFEMILFWTVIIISVIVISFFFGLIVYDSGYYRGIKNGRRKRTFEMIQLISESFNRLNLANTAEARIIELEVMINAYEALEYDLENEDF